MAIPVEIQLATKNATGNFLIGLQHHHWPLGMCQHVTGTREVNVLDLLPKFGHLVSNVPLFGG